MNRERFSLLFHASDYIGNWNRIRIIHKQRALFTIERNVIIFARFHHFLP